MTNLRLGFVLIFTLLFLALFANVGSAQNVVLTPDGVTGEVVFRVNTATNDARLVDTCIYRTDAGSPTPNIPVACAPVASGRAPASPGETSPNGEGVVLDIPVVVAILPEDQTFGARNIAVVEGSQIPSLMSPNSAILPFGVVAPLFVVPGS